MTGTPPTLCDAAYVSKDLFFASSAMVGQSAAAAEPDLVRNIVMMSRKAAVR